MYANGRLKPGQRQRLQRMLGKEDERLLTRSRSREALTPSRSRRQKSVPRVKASFHTPYGSRQHTPLLRTKSRQSRSRSRPASTLPPACPSCSNCNGNSMSKNDKTPNQNNSNFLHRAQSEKEILALDRLSLGAGENGSSKRVQIAGTGISSTRSRTQSALGSRRSYTRPGEISPKEGQGELARLVQQKLAASASTSQLHPRNSTMTVLFGCREEVGVSPDATPRPNRLMREREAAKGAGGTNWISIVEHNQRIAERDQRRTEKMEKAVRNEFNKHLAIQREAERDSLHQEVVQREQEKLRLQTVYKRWADEDAEQQAKQFKRLQQYKVACRQQFNELEQRRRFEHEKWRRRDARRVAALKQSLAEEAAQNEKKKIENSIKMRQMVEEYDLQRERKREEARREQEEAIRLQKEYAEQLERQERQRAENLAKIQQRQSANLQSLLAATKSFKEQAEEDERRAEREQAEVRRRAEQADRDKAERLRKEQELINKTVLKQQADNRAAAEQDKRERREFGDSLNRDAELYAEELKEQGERQRKKLCDAADVIREQMRFAEQRKLAERAEMNDNERMYNRTLLNECKRSAREHTRRRQFGNREDDEEDDAITTERMARFVNQRSPFRWRFENRPRPF